MRQPSPPLRLSAEAAEPVTLARLDCTLEQVGGSEAFLGLGLNNHMTGGYYWGRASGPGAAMPAPGVALRSAEEGLHLVRVENSNDGKRSEWCEFLRRDDQCQIVPADPRAALNAFDTVVGICRMGDAVPPGAEPIVDAIWQRNGAGEWERSL